MYVFQSLTCDFCKLLLHVKPEGPVPLTIISFPITQISVWVSNQATLESFQEGYVTYYKFCVMFSPLSKW